MNVRLVPIASLYRAGESLFERTICDLTREQGLACTGASNPPLWIAAHLVGTRFGLLQMIGVRCDRPWGDRFTRGAERGDLASIPEASEIVSCWKTAVASLGSRLPLLTDAELDAPSPRKLPIEDASVLGAMGFLAWHEGYHFGQLALARKTLGLPGLVG
jgi:hypothetical protein